MDNEAALVKASCDGDQSAYRQLVERYQDFVFTIALRVLRNRESAEEAAQDAFVKAYQNLGTFRSKSKFSTWLYAIAWRTAIDYSRKSKLDVTAIEDIKQVDLDVENAPSAENVMDEKDLKAQLKGAMDKLPPDDASLITLFYLREQSVAEVAEITGLSRSNVKTKLFRLREQLRQYLSPALKQYYTN